MSINNIYNLTHNTIMKQIMIIMTIIFAPLIMGAGQNETTTTLDLLKSTNWYPQDFWRNNRGYEKFTDTTSIFVYDIDGKISRDTSLFYLSNSIETVFDFSKVGKSVNGKYIIRVGPHGSYIYEILELSTEKYRMKYKTEGYTSHNKEVLYLPTELNF